MNEREAFELWFKEEWLSFNYNPPNMAYDELGYIDEVVGSYYSAWQHQQQRIEILLEQQDRLIAMNESLQAQRVLLEKQNTAAVEALEFIVDESSTHYEAECRAMDAVTIIKKIGE